MVADQAEATREQVRIGAAALRASVRPWLTKGERDPAVELAETDASHFAVNVWLRNSGPGIALIGSCQIVGPGARPGTILKRTGTVAKPLLPPTHDTGITLRVEGEDVDKPSFLNQGQTWGHFSVLVFYADTNPEQQVRAEIRIVAGDPEGRSWMFDELAYTAAPPDGPEEPIATVKFRSLGL